jgi:hypothetical protein
VVQFIGVISKYSATGDPATDIADHRRLALPDTQAE